MMEKLNNFFKGIIKNNYKLIITYIIIILLFTIPLNYEVYTPGGLVNLDNRIEIDGSHESKGSLNLTYVGGKKGIIPIVLLSYIIPGWDLVSLDNSRIETEDYEEIVERNKVYLNEINSNAIIVSFNALDKKYEITDNQVTIIHVYNYADTNVKTGDEVLSIENINVKDFNEFAQIIDSLNVGTKVNMKVLRNGRELDAYGVIQNIEGKKYIGVALSDVAKLKTDPKVEFKFKNSEMGPSGGLMTALKIYDMLTKEDITKGKVISGTGTIDSDGTVGAISGIKYKLAGAVRKKASIFIVPEGNYEEALKEKEKNKYDIKLIKASTFENVLESLATM